MQIVFVNTITYSSTYSITYSSTYSITYSITYNNVVQAIFGIMGSQSLLHLGALSVRLSEVLSGIHILLSF